MKLPTPIPKGMFDVSFSFPQGVEVHLVNPVHERAHWLALRQQDITSSDVGVLFESHPYKTLAQVMRAKLHGERDKPNAHMIHGRRYEYVTAARVAEERPDWEIHDYALYLRDPEFNLGTTLERVVLLPSDTVKALEIKTRAYSHWHAPWDWSNAPHPYATLQVLVQSMLLGAAGGLVACEQRSGFGPGEFAIHEVPRRPGLERVIRQKAAAFKRRVEECRR